MKNYMVYYFCQMLVNALLLSVYIVQALSEHHPCLSKNGHNITLRFEFSFKLGMLVLFIDSVNTSIVEIYYRFRVQYEENLNGVVSSGTLRTAMISTVIGWVLKSAILTVSIIQILVVRSSYG